MNRIVTIFVAMLILIMSVGVLLVSGMVFDSGEKLSIQPYFFQPNNLSTSRIGVPESPDDLGPDAMRERLIKKFVTEYFYALPDMQNYEWRISNRGPMAELTRRSQVFANWLNDEAETIKKLVEAKAMRLVEFNENSLYKHPDSDYWEVYYQLKTWEKPNDLSQEPITTDGKMFLEVSYTPGLRQTVIERGVHKELDSGRDPASLFKFGIISIGNQ